jgi:tRNA(fMet)-specific endonuclease VapC
VTLRPELTCDIRETNIVEGDVADTVRDNVTLQQVEMVGNRFKAMNTSVDLNLFCKSKDMRSNKCADTNILSDLVRNSQGVVATQIAKAGEESVCTSIIVAAELRYGAMKSNFATLAERVDLILSALEILSLETPADRKYASIRHHLTRQGTLIGPNDLLIAAHAPANDLTVITADVGEFSRVPGLNVENWLQA